MTDDWEARLAAKREARAARQGEPLPTMEAPPSLTPIDMGVGQSKTLAEFEKAKPPEVLDNDGQVDWLVEQIDILDAYRRWVGKEVKPFAAGQTENIMVSCPNPGHADNNPSAAINLDKQLYMCYACDIGGDKFTMASNHFNIPMDGVKFNDLRRRIVSEVYGWSFEKNAQGFPVGVSPEEKQKRIEYAEQSAREAIEDKNVLSIVPEDDDELGDYGDDEEIPPVSFDWTPLADEDTFISTYMREVTTDHAPEEYHFWNALQCVSLAMGRDMYEETSYNLFSNLFTCILGSTGSGKSMSKNAMEKVLEGAMPFDPDRPMLGGVYVVPGTGSGESLVDMFVGEHVTKRNAAPLSKSPVTGFVQYDELSDIIARGGRQGSTLKPYLLQFADAKGKISAKSRGQQDAVAVDSFMNFSTSTQPKLLQTLLSKDDVASGFLNRFVFITGTPKPEPPFPIAPVALNEPIDSLKKLREWCKGHGAIQWSEDAREEYEKWHHKNEPYIKSGKTSDLIKRGIATTRKLIMIFSANAMEEFVSVESVAKATSLWPYLTETYAILDTSIAYSEDADFEDKLIETIRMIMKRDEKKGVANWQWVNLSRIYEERRKQGWSRTKISKMLDLLYRSGALEFAEEVRPQGRGRPKKKCYTLAGTA